MLQANLATSMRLEESVRDCGFPPCDGAQARVGRDGPASMRDSPEVKQVLANYFASQLLIISSKVSAKECKPIATTQLPLARIKRIMKQDSCDPHPRMISADTIPFMAYAVKLFIGSMTKLAWQLFTQPSKRNTLQLKDLINAINASSQHDFLVDVVVMFNDSRDSVAKSTSNKQEDPLHDPLDMIPDDSLADLMMGEIPMGSEDYS